MLQKPLPGAFGNKVTAMLETGGLLSPADAVAHALKKHHIIELRYRVQVAMRENFPQGTGVIFTNLFDKDTPLSNADMNEIVQQADSVPLMSLINSLSRYDQIEKLDYLRIERFIAVSTEKLLMDERTDDYNYIDDLTVDVSPHNVYRLMAKTCQTMSLEKLSAMAISLAREMSSKDMLLDSILSIHGDVEKEMSSKTLSSSNIRYAELVTEIIKDISTSNSFIMNKINLHFSVSDSLFKKIDQEKYSSRLYTNISLHKANIFDQINQFIFQKTSYARYMFGLPTTVEGRVNMPQKMASMMILVTDSSLSNEDKKSWCTQIVKIALEQRTLNVSKEEIEKIVTHSHDHIDYEVLLKNLSKKGTNNLIECINDRTPFVHLLHKKYKGKAFETALGI